MTYDPNADRDYWRSEVTGRLIEAARDSGHELAIALGERLEQLHEREEWADQIDDLKSDIETLRAEAASHFDEMSAADAALEACDTEIRTLKHLLADATGCARP